MKVAHIVQNVTGTSIPIEIAVEISRNGVDCGVVSVDPLPINLPDILDGSIVVDSLSPVASYDRLIGSLMEMGFDIIHTHHNRSAALISILCKYKYKSINHFNTQHGHPHYSFGQKIINLATLYYCSKFVYNSRVTRSSYSGVEQILMSGGEHKVIHNGINLSVLEGYKANIEDNKYTISTAARIIPRKNIAEVIKALGEFPDLNLKIIGDGPARPQLERTVKRGKLGNRVEFVGFLTHREDVYREISESSCFVLPSRAEGFGVGVVEAMALGLPVIVSDIPIFREVVGEHGIYVDPDSPSSIAAAIQWVLEDTDRAKRTGYMNQRRATSRFGIKRTAQSYIDFYRTQSS